MGRTPLAPAPRSHDNFLYIDRIVRPTTTTSFVTSTTSSKMPLPVLLLLLLISPSSSSLPPPVRLPLRLLTPSLTKPKDPLLQQLATAAAASLLRARHLKNPSRRSRKHPQLSETGLSPHSYGGYSLSLSFGTPPQTIPLIFDTGSDLTWVPCTHTYACRNCSSSSPTPVFLPKSSSSSRIIGCKNPKCGWIHSSRTILSRCQENNATARICPAYLIMYGLGTTAGILLDETLVLPGNGSVSSFALGCSVLSSRQPPAGIAGFGRGPTSITSQLHLERFSYCLVSRRYDDRPGKVGSVVLGGRPESASHDNVSSTPFLTNPAATPGSPFSVYYYVKMNRISVGGKKVKIPYEYLVPGDDGSGGTIVDSGSTFTFMEAAVVDLVVEAFVKAVKGRYKRSTEVEAATGLRLCFSAPEEKEVRLPQLEFHFKGGARMGLPAENYFAVLSDAGAMCLMVISDDGRSSGPAIILGAFQQQNYHMLFDLQRQRLGFKRMNCAAP